VLRFIYSTTPQICQCFRLKPVAHPDPNESLEFTQKRSFILSKLMDSRPTKIDPNQPIASKIRCRLRVLFQSFDHQLKIQWTFGLLDRSALNCVGINHRRSQIAVAQ
jgi:hypothetical protein